MVNLVVKLGHFLFPYPPKPKALKGYAKIFEALHSEGCGLVLVAGGGMASRGYIEALRRLHADETVCDEAGISVSRLNARLMAAALGDLAYPAVPRSLEELRAYSRHDRIVVMGGLTPGHSTAAVGALAAEALNADIYIIATDVDGIYSEDPKADPKARKFEEITTEKLLELALKGKLWAGTYQLDPLAVKIIERSGVTAYFLDGRRKENIMKASLGGKVGTKIIPRS
ncbi:MAG: uridylate kinase [Candidatus Hecatellales archaeon B24]|nr:MAG: uridylate kinase [Candidatus Hecatellales archaeon B24]